MKKNDFLNHYFEKRKSLIFRYFLAFLLIILAFWILIDKSSSENFIAKIYLNGVINDRSSLIKKINKLKEDSKVKGLLLVTNSPGGTFVSSKEIFDTLKRISEKIPTATYIREIGTSGAYLASLGTDRIFVNYGSITGSIGVILQTANLKNLLENLGIEPIVIKSGDLKAVPNPFEELDQNKINYVSEVIDQMQNQFLQIVKERRNLKDNEIEKISDGRIFTGTQAIKLNLIDEIGSEDDAANWIKKEGGLDEDTKLIEFDDNEKYLEFLNLNFFKKSFNSFNLNINNGILAIWTLN